MITRRKFVAGVAATAAVAAVAPTLLIPTSRGVGFTLTTSHARGFAMYLSVGDVIVMKWNDEPEQRAMVTSITDTTETPSKVAIELEPPQPPLYI